MTTKAESLNTNVDWAQVNKATEVARTYLMRDNEGNEFFKMYKPSEANKVMHKKGWTGKIIGILDRSRGRK